MADLRRLVQKYRKRRPAKCMYRDDKGQRCSNTAIQSHTVQKGGALKEIAEKGHVLTLAVDTFSRDGGSSFDFTSRGCRQASIFPGFCKKHDQELFLPVEDQDVQLDIPGLVLLSYRAICQELHKKEDNIRLFSNPEIRDAVPENARRKFDAFLHGSRLAATDLERAKQEHEEALFENDFQGFHAIAFYMLEPMPIACSGTVSPEFDFRRNKILPDERDDWYSVFWYTGKIGRNNVFAIGGFTEDRAQDIEGFIRSLRDIPMQDVGDIAFNFSVFYSENSYFRPSWIENLPATDLFWMKSTFRDTIPGEASTGAAAVFESKKLVRIPATDKTYFVH